MLFSVVVAILLAVCSFALNLPQEFEKRQRAAVVTGCTVANTAALTFDDGPYNYIYDISKTLRKYNATGTFFFNGNNYGCIYSSENVKRVQYVYQQGHQVGSHTWAHKNLAALSTSAITDEMRRVDEALKRITGAVPAFMRPPYGSYNNRVLDVAGSRKETVVIWDFDSGDSVGVSVSQQKSRYSSLATRRPKTILALNHETIASSVYDVLPYAITKLQAKGYKLVTVAQCLGKKPYQSVGSPSIRTSAWHC